MVVQDKNGKDANKILLCNVPQSYNHHNVHNSENALKGRDVVPRHGDQRGNDDAKAAAEHLETTASDKSGTGNNRERWRRRVNT